jgi:hypothetical protein
MEIGMCDNEIVDNKAALAANNPNQIVMEPCNRYSEVHSKKKSKMNLKRARKLKQQIRGSIACKIRPYSMVSQIWPGCSRKETKMIKAK